MRYLFLLLTSACCGLQPVPSNAKVSEMVSRTLKLTVTCEEPSLSTGGSAVRLGHHAVLTAKHITENREACEYTAEDSEGSTIDLKFVRESDDYDVALLSESLDLYPTEMVVGELGEGVWAVGYPAIPGTSIQELSATAGTISGAPNDQGEVRITNSIWFGSSGGGAWNANGRLLGITVSFRGLATGYSYMIGMEAIREFLRKDIEDA